MKISNLKDLLVEQIKDLYSAEQLQLEFIPKLVEKISSISLKNTILQHKLDTEEQISRLEEVFQILGLDHNAEYSASMKGLIWNLRELIDNCESADVIDAAVIAGMQHIEHYEIVSYGNSATYAQMVGQDEVATTLHSILKQEKSFDKRLTELAIKKVNDDANLVN